MVAKPCKFTKISCMVKTRILWFIYYTSMKLFKILTEKKKSQDVQYGSISEIGPSVY